MVAAAFSREREAQNSVFLWKKKMNPIPGINKSPDFMDWIRVAAYTLVCLTCLIVIGNAAVRSVYFYTMKMLTKDIEWSLRHNYVVFFLSSRRILILC